MPGVLCWYGNLSLKEDDVGSIPTPAAREKIMDNLPCKPDHNGECLICDCWLSDCAWKRFLNKDYTYETPEQLEKMFKDFKTERNDDARSPL